MTLDSTDLRQCTPEHLPVSGPPIKDSIGRADDKRWSAATYMAFQAARQRVSCPQTGACERNSPSRCGCPVMQAGVAQRKQQQEEHTSDPLSPSAYHAAKSRVRCGPGDAAAEASSAGMK